MLDEMDGDHTHTRISKQDISQPTHASGPLFSTGSAPDSDEEDNLSAAPTLSEQRRKVSHDSGYLDMGWVCGNYYVLLVGEVKLLCAAGGRSEIIMCCWWEK